VEFEKVLAPSEFWQPQEVVEWLQSAFLVAGEVVLLQSSSKASEASEVVLLPSTSLVSGAVGVELLPLVYLAILEAGYPFVVKVILVVHWQEAQQVQNSLTQVAL
jgi:hypothetical protein